MPSSGRVSGSALSGRLAFGDHLGEQRVRGRRVSAYGRFILDGFQPAVEGVEDDQDGDRQRAAECPVVLDNSAPLLFFDKF